MIYLVSLLHKSSATFKGNFLFFLQVKQPVLLSGILVPVLEHVTIQKALCFVAAKKGSRGMEQYVLVCFCTFVKFYYDFILFVMFYFVV